ncbi:MAG: hypothetical protein ACYDBA_04325 [Sulfuricaulis sp.]
MEALTKNQLNISQSLIRSSGKREIERCLLSSVAKSDIICQYAVVVQQISVAGLDLIEFEFPPDAA